MFVPQAGEIWVKIVILTTQNLELYDKKANKTKQ